MDARPPVYADLDDVFFIARRVLGLLKDPRSNAARLGRLIDTIEPLADAVVAGAEGLLAERGRVVSTAHAITLLGYDRLERVVRRFVHLELARLTTAPTDLGAPRYAAV